MYQVVVFLHVLSVVIFMLIHGVSVFVMLAVRRQENPEHVRALMALRGKVSPAVPTFAVVILVTGIIAASMGDWWPMSWPRISLALFIGIAVVMTSFGRRYFNRIAEAVGSTRRSEVQSSALPAELAAQLRRAPVGFLMLVGIIGVGIILWLMLFKPF